jgi:hypothetical protein
VHQMQDARSPEHVSRSLIVLSIVNEQAEKGQCFALHLPN